MWGQAIGQAVNGAAGNAVMNGAMNGIFSNISTPAIASGMSKMAPDALLAGAGEVAQQGVMDGILANVIGGNIGIQNASNAAMGNVVNPAAGGFMNNVQDLFKNEAVTNGFNMAKDGFGAYNAYQAQRQASKGMAANQQRAEEAHRFNMSNAKSNQNLNF